MFFKIYNQVNLSKLTTLKLLFIVMLYSINSQAQDNPFNCDDKAYLFQKNDVYAIDLASGISVLAAEDFVEGSVNAVGYNPKDGHIWGVVGSGEQSILQVDKDFNATSYYIEELPQASLYVGDINSEGIYYLKGSGTQYHTIDLDSASDTYTQYLESLNLSLNINIHDWAFNAADSMLYSVEKLSNILYRINPLTGEVIALGEVPILGDYNYTYGAVYFDEEGRFYISANETGTIYVIQEVQNINTVFDMDSNIFAFGPSSGNNDGARCSTAAVLQEICDNGIDDDNDGLIDCEDPSCSGYGSCEVIDPPTSGSNNGGLESNSRLSEQINARNFKRAKGGYNFDKKKAKRISSDNNYATKDPNGEFKLNDLVPLNCIHEDEAIEATPNDLANITNATEVFSVDYLKGGNTIASVLILKTEKAVYEHTKYICDRLLGAELISVSTMTINGQDFIKSIIRNEHGTLEFVLSFSGILINNGNDLVIENHWNLDKYTTDGTYYNFQVWSNSIDDLYSLGKEALKLLEIQKPITNYYHSAPPAVFVKKGQYIDGALDLEIVNTNGTTDVMFDAGYRETETGEFKTLQSNIPLNGETLTQLRYEIGGIFDIGFRISDGVNTPDDIFMSDGPWGVDDSGTETTIDEYTISQNDFNFDFEDLAIERNVNLKAKTNSYVAVYRALTPRYQAVDVSTFESLQFTAEGNGILEITLVKQAIEKWEDQMKSTIILSEEAADFSLSLSEFTNSTGEFLKPNDIVTIVFTMVSENGETVSKEMSLSNLRFSNNIVLSNTSLGLDKIATKVYPNPMSYEANIEFSSNKAEQVELEIYDNLGALVRRSSLSVTQGNNKYTIRRMGLHKGSYFIMLRSETNWYKPIKLVIEGK